MIFFTTSAGHLAPQIHLAQGKLTVKQFSDGELYVRVEEDVKSKQVWVIASTPSAESIIELLLILNALQRESAFISLIITYFGYSRQDRAVPGEALAASVISSLLLTANVQKIFIIHAHSARLKQFLNFENKIPLDLFCIPAQESNRIAAPDQGAYEFVAAIGEQCGREAVVVTKMRPEQEKVKIMGVTDAIEGKHILIVDDIISTGTTLISVAHALKERGASTVSAAATHGVFSDGAHTLLDESPLIERIYVTNTLVQDTTWDKITILNIAPFIQNIIVQSS